MSVNCLASNQSCLQALTLFQVKPIELTFQTGVTPLSNAASYTNGIVVNLAVRVRLTPPIVGAIMITFPAEYAPTLPIYTYTNPVYLNDYIAPALVEVNPEGYISLISISGTFLAPVDLYLNFTYAPPILFA
jgi:hypothetical protein